MAWFSRQKKNEKKNEEDRFEDRPISSTDNDCLSFGELINPLAELIADRRAPLTIGIYGEWGSGKTSFLNLLKKRLDTPYGIESNWFDAWKYDKKDNLWAALIQTVLNQTGKRGKPFTFDWVNFRIWLFQIDLKAGSWEITKKLLALLLRIVIILLCIIVGIKSVDIGKALTGQSSSLSFIPSGVSSVFIAAIVSAIGILALDPGKLWSLFKGDIHFDFSKFERKLSFRDHIAFFDEFSQQFKDLTERLHPDGKPLVIIIDDLDRCLPAHMLQVLEAIKVFLDSANCVFLLGIDKQVVEMAAAARFKNFSEDRRQLFEEKKASIPNRGRAFHEEYLDKIISLALTIPQPGQEQQVRDFIRNLNKGKDGKGPYNEAVEDCIDIFNAGLPPNLRKIKRVLYSFCFALKRSEARDENGKLLFNDIEKHLLAKLIIIQNQYARVYEDVISQPSLPGELEQIYSGHSGGGKMLSAQTSTIYEELYGSRLIELLLKDSEKASFFGKNNILDYLKLLGSLADTGPLLDTRTLTALDNGLPLASIPRRNPRFIARIDILRILWYSFSHKHLNENSCVALTGPAGIGKTQIAIEYAFHYSDRYKKILWVRSATRETLFSDYMAIAEGIEITGAASAQSPQDQYTIRNAVKSWLENNPDWLLIFDGVSDLDIAHEFFPQLYSGHILLTTPLKITEEGISSIEVNELQVEESIRLLLLQAGIMSPYAPPTSISREEKEKAGLIVEQLNRLPLVLVQAGAYIKNTRCGLDEYLKRHTSECSKHSSRPEVAATWSLSFQQVKGNLPAAWELLRLCAFLAPDDIPIGMLAKAATSREPGLEPIARLNDQLNLAIDELEKFSLVRRSPDGKTLAILKPMQDVLKDQMGDKDQQDLANCALLLIYHAFPVDIGFKTRKECQLYLPQALACAAMIKQRNFSSTKDKEFLLKAARLFDRAGRYQRVQVQLDRAEKLLREALAIREKVLNREDSDYHEYISSLSNLGALYNEQERYAEAEQLLKSALTIGKNILKDNDPRIATILNEIGMNYLAQDRYREAEQPFKSALTIRRQMSGPDYTTSLNNLAGLYYQQGKYDDALPLFKEALDIREKTPGEEDPLVATSLNNLAGLYCQLGRYKEAIPLFEKALVIRKKVLGESHPDVAIISNNLAQAKDSLKPHESEAGEGNGGAITT